MDIKLVGNAEHAVIEMNGRVEGGVGFDFFVIAERARRLNPSGTIEVDLAGVDFIDTLGIRGLLHLNRQLRAAGRRLALANLRPDVRQALRALRVDELMAAAAS